MWRYILWKTLLSIIAFFVIITIFYFAYVSVKGNPFLDLKDSSPEKYKTVMLAHPEISQPIVERYGNWFKNIFYGDFGIAYKGELNKTIPQRFFGPFEDSMKVSLPSFFLGMLLGLSLGVWAGYKRGKITDRIINGITVFFIAIPVFVFAAFAIIIGPLVGLPTLYEKNIGIGYELQTLILPIILTTLISLASWTKYMRIEIGNILSSDYILAARTRGYSEWFIFRRYVLRNAMYPFIGSLVTSFMIIFASSIIIEKFFGIGGTSKMMLEAMSTGEINLVMFQMLFLLILGIFSQIIVDIAQFLINPIIKSNFSSKTSPIARMKFVFIRFKNGLNITKVLRKVKHD